MKKILDYLEIIDKRILLPRTAQTGKPSLQAREAQKDREEQSPEPEKIDLLLKL